jgi:hypothetical protein
MKEKIPDRKKQSLTDRFIKPIARKVTLAGAATGILMGVGGGAWAQGGPKEVAGIGQKAESYENIRDSFYAAITEAIPALDMFCYYTSLNPMDEERFQKYRSEAEKAVKKAKDRATQILHSKKATEQEKKDAESIIGSTGSGPLVGPLSKPDGSGFGLAQLRNLLETLRGLEKTNKQQ